MINELVTLFYGLQYTDTPVLVDKQKYVINFVRTLGAV